MKELNMKVLNSRFKVSQLKSLFFMLMVSFLLSSVALANPIYVSSSGSATGAGTRQDPVDLQTAIDLSAPGGEIRIRSVTMTIENILIDKPLLIRGNTVQLTCRGTQGSCIEIDLQSRGVVELRDINSFMHQLQNPPAGSSLRGIHLKRGELLLNNFKATNTPQNSFSSFFQAEQDSELKIRDSHFSDHPIRSRGYISEIRDSYFANMSIVYNGRPNILRSNSSETLFKGNRMLDASFVVQPQRNVSETLKVIENTFASTENIANPAQNTLMMVIAGGQGETVKVNLKKNSFVGSVNLLSLEGDRVLTRVTNNRFIQGQTLTGGEATLVSLSDIGMGNAPIYFINNFFYVADSVGFMGSTDDANDIVELSYNTFVVSDVSPSLFKLNNTGHFRINNNLIDMTGHVSCAGTTGSPVNCAELLVMDQQVNVNPHHNYVLDFDHDISGFDIWRGSENMNFPTIVMDTSQMSQPIYAGNGNFDYTNPFYTIDTGMFDLAMPLPSQVGLSSFPPTHDIDGESRVNDADVGAYEF
jgi:hypothetical protein